jgi:molybdopterin converting factor small subunit
MEVEVRLYGGLEKYVGAGVGQSLSVQLSSGGTGRDLLAALGIPESAVFTVLVNGRHRTLSDRLEPGDRVTFFPPIAGG